MKRQGLPQIALHDIKESVDQSIDSLQWHVTKLLAGEFTNETHPLKTIKCEAKVRELRAKLYGIFIEAAQVNGNEILK